MYAMGHRYTERDLYVGPSKQEARTMGWTRKREGTLRMFFCDGLLMEAYSYNTCIMTRMTPCDDFPWGRMILNETKYGPTSNNHMSTVLSYCRKFVRGPEYEHTVTYSDGTTHTHTDSEYILVESVDYRHRAILIDLGMNLTGGDLELEVISMQIRATEDRICMRQRRIERIAQIRRANAAIDAENACENVIQLFA